MKLKKNYTSGYTGVTWFKQRRKWMAQIVVERRRYGLGYFPSAELAYQAYFTAKRALHSFQPIPREHAHEQEWLTDIARKFGKVG
jgi:hypothetical protein